MQEIIEARMEHHDGSWANTPESSLCKRKSQSCLSNAKKRMQYQKVDGTFIDLKYYQFTEW